MRQHTSTTANVTSSNVGVEQKFNIKQTAKAFQILSSGLYSNKILAVVRELSCNAWDAHVAAGKGDVPIEIKLPTHIDDTFYVKDFGIGLDHDQVMQLYTTYFESTKTDSNDFIGALGLGSKSPFSYTNNFVVESRFNNVKRVYSAFINDAGFPAIVMMGEDATDESNGLTVMFSVKPSDRRAFAEAASEALVYFNPTPIIKGTADTKVKPIKFVLTGTGWNVRARDNTQYVGGGVRVVQGFVSYPVDMYQLADATEDPDHNKLLSALRRIDMDVIVPIGDVEVAASREALSYDKRTMSNLSTRLVAMASVLAAELQRELNAKPTLWAATKLYSDYTQSGSHFRDLVFAANEFTYNGQPINDVVQLTLTADHSNVMVERRHRRKTKSTVEGTFVYTKDAVTATTFGANPATMMLIIDDIGHSVIRTVDTWMNLKHESDVLVFRNSDTKQRQPVDMAAVEDIMAQVGLTLDHTDIVMMSTITTKLPRSKSTYVKKVPGMYKMWDGYAAKSNQSRRYRHGPELNRTYSRLTWKEATIDMNDAAVTGYYVPIERFTIVRAFNGRSVESIDLLLKAAIKVGAIQAPLPLIGVTEADMKKVNTKNWANLFDTIAKYIEQEITGGLCEELGRNQLASDIDYDGAVKSAWKVIGPMVDACDLKTFLDKTFSDTAVQVAAWKELFAMFDPVAQNKITDSVQASRNIYGQLGVTYDVLEFIDWSRCHYKRNAEAAAKYLNICITSLT